MFTLLKNGNTSAVIQRLYHGNFVTVSGGNKDYFRRYQFSAKGAVTRAMAYDRDCNEFVDCPSFSTLDKEEVALARKVWQKAFGGGPSAKQIKD